MYSGDVLHLPGKPAYDQCAAMQLPVPTGVESNSQSLGYTCHQVDLINLSGDSIIVLEIDNPLCDRVTLFSLDGNAAQPLGVDGFRTGERRGDWMFPTPAFRVNLPVGEKRHLGIRIAYANEVVAAPVVISSEQTFYKRQLNKNIISGVHVGILLVMLFYNLFLYASVRDTSYLYYTIYILFIGLTQTTLTGYTHRYLFLGHPDLLNYTIVLFPAMAGISAIMFTRAFLHTREHTPRLDRLFLWLIPGFVGAIMLRFLGFNFLSARAIDLTDIGTIILAYAILIKLIRKGNRQAIFFIVAWTAFVVGLVLFVMKNLGALPSNIFTNYTMHAGTALEVALLSIALADKINTLNRSNKISQERELVTAQENARLVQNQNAILEERVTRRTYALQKANNELSTALTSLKEAQTHLVESEKMASLGQLTAGIAHEINNPINFVTSNIKPLRRDVQEVFTLLEQMEAVAREEIPTAEKFGRVSALKEAADYDYIKSEIEVLLSGIHEGSTRTAEIVRGLRIFSRLDEDDLKRADVNEGLDSTCIIVNNLLNNRILIQKSYGNFPLVECYPGKLNQVWLNIITNGIHAVRSRFGEDSGGAITIATTANEDHVTISIRDNGCGMTEQTKAKLFEPFFTTKDVGEGTGLGLSIVYNTVKKHNGLIYVESAVGQGTEFRISLPIIQPTDASPASARPTVPEHQPA